MIFGNNGDSAQNIGKIKHWQDGQSQIHNGAVSSENGISTIKVGNSSFTGSKTIISNGNSFSVDGQSFTRCGNTLCGPNGQSWTGVNSKQDAIDIISHTINKNR